MITPFVHPSRSEAVTAYLREAILRGDFADARLPGERDLAERLGVSRPTLRNALKSLSAEGLNRRRHGADTNVGGPKSHTAGIGRDAAR